MTTTARVMQLASIVAVGFSATYSLATGGRWVVLVPLFVGFVCAFLFGLTEGRRQVVQALRQASPIVNCVGGPMDGEAVPSPPAVFGTGATVTLVCDAHPEGSYHLEAGQFVWAEGDDE